MDADLPSPVRDLVSRHLREVDGLVEKLYLVGSLALGDYQHGVSDIDFVAFTSRHPSDGDLHTLTEIHNGLPRYDGVYLDREALCTTPDSGEVVPHVLPTWTELTRRALLWRQGHRNGVRFVTADGHATAAMVDAVVDDAWERWG